MDLKLKKKISKMNMEELNKFLDNECKTLQDRENLLFELNNKPYIELSEKYKDIKDLPNIILVSIGDMMVFSQFSTSRLATSNT